MIESCFGIYFNDGTEKSIWDLTRFNYFFRPKITEFLLASSKEIIDRTSPGSIIDLEISYGSMVGIRSIESTCLIFTTESQPHDYLVKLAKHIIHKGLAPTIAENFEYIKTDLTVKKIEEEIDKTKYVMINNIELIIKRGEKIEDLVSKSQYLSNSSRNFFTNSKKLNSCCIVL